MGIETGWISPYLAGMIDADGHITIQRNLKKNTGRCAPAIYHCLNVGISGTDRKPLDLASAMFGSKVHRYDPPKQHYKSYYQWIASGPSALRVLESIKDYLLVKQEQAFVGIRFQNTLIQQVASRKGTPLPHRITERDVIEREAFFQEMTLLNNPTNRRVNLVGENIDQRKRAADTLYGKIYHNFPEVSA